MEPRSDNQPTPDIVPRCPLWESAKRQARKEYPDEVHVELLTAHALVLVKRAVVRGEAEIVSGLKR